MSDSRYTIREPRHPDFQKDWDDFQHEYTGEPLAVAEWVNGMLHVAVYVIGNHWLGNYKPEERTDEGMGFILHPRDLVLLAKGCGVPFIRCAGFHTCRQLEVLGNEDDCDPGECAG